MAIEKKKNRGALHTCVRDFSRERDDYEVAQSVRLEASSEQNTHAEFTTCAAHFALRMQQAGLGCTESDAIRCVLKLKFIID